MFNIKRTILNVQWEEKIIESWRLSETLWQKKGLRWKSLPVLIQYPMKNHIINGRKEVLVCCEQKIFKINFQDCDKVYL